MKEILINLLYTVFTTSIPVITYSLVKFLTMLFDKAQIETESTAMSDTIVDVLNLVQSAVISTSQTYVDSLKASGTFDEAAQKKAFNDTKEKILSLLSEEAKGVIKTLYVDLDEWLNIQIENAVKQTKN